MRNPLPTSWHFERPQLADHHLRTFDLGLISATALHAKPRMGKTEFLTKDLTPKAVERGYVVGYCNLWQEDQDPAEAIAEAVIACSAPRRVLAKVRDRLNTHVSKLKVSGKITGMAEGGAEIEFKGAEKTNAAKLRAAFAEFDRSKNRGLLF